MPVYTCKIELKNEEEVVYHDVFNKPRPGKIRVSELDKRLLRRFNYWVSSDRLNERDDLELLGLCLYDLLFPPQSDIRDEFEGNYDFVMRPDQKGSRLRLTLVFHKAAGELANYPWEFLYMPLRQKTPEKEERKGFFLAGKNPELILARFMPDVEHRLGEKEKELRILIVFSNPNDYDLDDLNTKETKDAIETIKALEQPDSQVKVKEINNPTYAELKDAINEPEQPGEEAFKPHIVHFIGHGDKKLGLALQMTEEECEQRKQNKLPPKAAWYNSQTICDLFSDDPPPRLVFLHACEGAKSDTLEGFSDLARELAGAKVPAVIAMQYTIKPEVAAVFAKVFYEELGTGSDVDEAVRKGRAALGLPEYGGKGSWSDKRFGTPVVYLQSEKPIIEIPPKPPPKSGAFDPTQKIPCPNPECKGSIEPDCVECVLCEHPLIECPNCKKSSVHRLMSQKIGKCGKCGFRLGERKNAGVATSGWTTPERTQAQTIQPLVEAAPATAPPSLLEQSPTATIVIPDRGTKGN
jgi:ribosomal protein L37AE/L43A